MYLRKLGLLKAIASSRWFHPLLLVVWMAIGAGLRLMHLTTKAPWADEFSTIIFSLGHSFQTIPLDRAIAIDDLLQPLQPNPTAGIGEVIHYLHKESNHPPLYFVLAHFWMGLFPTEAGLASLWAARSLSALLGVASIPAMFGLSYLAFRSRLVGQMAAAMMAVSPYGIFLAREARHYTLAILLVIASLGCLTIATRSIRHRKLLPIWVGLTWVGINTLGVATHYFFTLTLCAEALVLLAQAWRYRTQLNPPLGFKWRRIYLVAVGTLTGSLVWLPLLHSDFSSDNSLTHWIYDGNPRRNFLKPIGRIIAWASTTLVSLPMELTTLPLTVAIASGLGTGIFLFWALPILYQGLKVQASQLDNRLSVRVLGDFAIGALALFLAITYILGADLTLAPRYQFVYFPVAIALVGAALATSWDTSISAVGIESTQFEQPSIVRPFRSGGKKAAVLIWLMALVGGLIIVWNLSYLQSLRADLLAKVIQHKSSSPVLIATTYQHHGQTGRMMGLAWEFKRLDRLDSPLSRRIASPYFLLADTNPGSPKGGNSTLTLQETVAKLPRPLDVWLVNFHARVDLPQQNCFADSKSLPKLDSYWYQLYRCPAPH